MGKKTGLNYIKKRLDDMRIETSEEQATEICKRVKELGERQGARLRSRVHPHRARDPWLI